MKTITLKALSWISLVLLSSVSLPAAHAESYSFGIFPQRSAGLSTQFWNPILEYVHRKTGITLVLKLAKTATESTDSIEKGEYDFVYANSIFLPRMEKANYQVILRPRDEVIKGQVVTLEDSPIKSLSDLEGKAVGFPAPTAFVGYVVPMDQLLHQEITVTPFFGVTQETVMNQLKAGKLPAIGVNHLVMKSYASRENVKYRVLWESAPFRNVPIAVNPRVPKSVLNAVRDAIDGMEIDAEGMKILEHTAHIVGQNPPFGFRSSVQDDYKSYIDFYRTTLVKDIK
jgi:phosphonate transport system substrate-binding protein